MIQPFIQSGLHENAFWVLGVTVRDDRLKIVAAADEKSLELDPAKCHKLRAQLTSPRSRLAAETAWLPGLSPTRAAELVRRLPLDLPKLCEERTLPRLARANLLASSLQGYEAGGSPDLIAAAISELALVSQSLDPEVVLREINEDRAIAAFPELKDVDVVQQELTEQRRRFRQAILALLDRVPSRTLVDIVTKVVERETETRLKLVWSDTKIETSSQLIDDAQPPELIEAVVDSYELHVQSFLETEASNVGKLVAAAREFAKCGERAIEPLVDQIEQVVRNWDWVAQPIQVSAKARGTDHQPSHQLASEVRALAVDLFNQAAMFQTVRRLNQLLGETFAEVPRWAEYLASDTQALDNIATERSEREASRRKWEQEVTYSGEVGVFPRSVLAISPAGVSWRGVTMALENISRVRWGGVRHSVNGIPTGTTYTIGVGDGTGEIVVSLRNEDVFAKFTEKLWTATGIHLMTSMIGDLREGPGIVFNDATIRDEGVTLRRHQWFKADKKAEFNWSELQIWSQGGSFFIGAKADRKMYVELSYVNCANVHILERVLQAAFKNGARKLSDLLND